MRLPKREYLFGKNHDQWIIPSNEYLNYVTPNDIADIVFKDANQSLELGVRLIWDMFAGVGTDAIRLSRYAGRVVGTEINPATYQCFLKNIESHGADNVVAYNDSCHRCIEKCLEKFSRPVIYFDPPWGQGYLSGQMFDLGAVVIGDSLPGADDITVKDLLLRLKKHDMIIKVPYLCDTVEENIDPDCIIHILTFSKHKIKFYIVRGDQKGSVTTKS